MLEGTPVCTDPKVTQEATQTVPSPPGLLNPTRKSRALGTRFCYSCPVFSNS